MHMNLNFKGSKSTGSIPPLVLLHGFDSSFLEFRRLARLLAKNRDVYVPDILGWGFTDCSKVVDLSPKAKLEHMKCFLQQIVTEPCILVGASLGGAVAINLATEICPELVERLVLIDAQVRFQVSQLYYIFKSFISSFLGFY